MGIRQASDAVLRHRMRAYYLPLFAGATLAASAFLPWVLQGEARIGGASGTAGLWVTGLGVCAMILAILSIITRRNSRHPILVVGLIALGILFIAYKWMARAANERAWATSQAIAIVDQTQATAQPNAVVGIGIYLGLGASLILVLFGLTIVVKKMARPYVQEEDD